MLKIANLNKEYKSGFTFGPLNLETKLNESLAILGINGAGKSTFFNLLTANLDPTGGSIHLNEQLLTPENYPLKKTLGYLPQELGFPPWNSPKELINYTAELYKDRISDPNIAIEAAIELWEIKPYINRPLQSCSHGMQKRVGLAISMLHSPDLLILDEPFSGLDLVHVNNLKKAILERNQAKKSTIISTHVLPFATQLCQRALIFKAGRLAHDSIISNSNWATEAERLENIFLDIN